MYKQQLFDQRQNGSKDWYLRKQNEKLAKSINRWDQTSETMKVPENQDCLFCSRIPQNRRSSKIGLRSHMFQCSVRRTLFNGHISNSSQNITLSNLHENFRQEYNISIQYKKNIQEPIQILISKIERLCLKYIDETNDYKSTNDCETLNNIICTISSVLKQILPNYIIHTMNLEKYFNNKLYRTYDINKSVQGVTTSMFAHFISCNVKVPLPLIYNLFENIELENDQNNRAATTLWMKSFIDLSGDIKHCNTYLRILGSKTLDQNNDSNNKHIMRVLNTASSHRNDWTSFLSRFIYRSINNDEGATNNNNENKLKNNGNDWDNADIGSNDPLLPKLSDAQIRAIGQTRYVIAKDYHKYQVYKENKMNKFSREELQSKEYLNSNNTNSSSKNNNNSSSKNNNDKGGSTTTDCDGDYCVTILSDDVVSKYPALSKPQGQPMYTFNQKYIAKQKRNKLLTKNAATVYIVDNNDIGHNDNKISLTTNVANERKRNADILENESKIQIEKPFKKRKVMDQPRNATTTTTASNAAATNANMIEKIEQTNVLGDSDVINGKKLNVFLGEKIKKGSRQTYKYVCKKKRWDEFSDLHLKQLVNKFGNDWRSVSKELPGYTEGQCRQRWHALVSGQVDESSFDNGPGDWSKHEDQAVAKWKHVYGNRWTDIAKQIPGRTDLMVKNRFYSCMRKIKRNAVHQNGQLGDTAIKYIATTYLEKFIVRQMRSGLMPIPEPVANRQTKRIRNANYIIK